MYIIPGRTNHTTTGLSNNRDCKDHDFEIMWVKLLLFQTACYWPPTIIRKVSFQELKTNTDSADVDSTHELVLLGDFNCILLPNVKEPKRKHLSRATINKL